jgi:hypothetical protein
MAETQKHSQLASVNQSRPSNHVNSDCSGHYTLCRFRKFWHA